MKFYFVFAVSIFLTSTRAAAEEYIRPSQPTGEKKVALVIGNSNYGGAASLRNPSNDADAMAAALEDLGFSVIKRKDVDLDEMEECFTQFFRSLNDGAVAFFFFAGHGLQVNGENYLVPVRAKIEEEIHVRRKCYSLTDVLAVMESSKSNLNVVVLDCCRDNPLKRSWTRSTAGKGLAAIEAVPEGTLIAFSTAPGETADDGDGNNSAYAGQLAKTLKSRPAGGLKLREAFFQASREVKRQTGQIPWMNMEASLDEYILVPAGNAGTSRPDMPLPPKTAPNQPPMKPLPNVPPADAPPSDAPFLGSLEGTTWHVVDSDGYRYLIHFKSNGVLHYEGDRGPRQNGNWKLTNGKIKIEFNGGYANLDGVISGNTIQGRGVSAGTTTWTWKATIKP